jgi:N-acyl-D-aspartate/D-glutamate deacylase
MSKFDLVIRGGVIHDGLGGAPYEADVAITGDTIRHIGRVSSAGREEIDATDLIVAPGWVDIHTHYDGQATWDQRLRPSSSLGVTTVVMGNCGVGFAPVRREHHDMLIGLMEGVEDIPGIALHEGLRWNWESFGDYLDALEAVPHDIDIGAQLPHSALRVYVMGERGARREPATAADCTRMRSLAAEAIRAGALGFSSSRSLNHRTNKKELIPSYGATAEELQAIALGLRDAAGGVLQYTTDKPENEGEWNMLCGLVRVSGRPLSVAIGQDPKRPELWKSTLQKIEKARAEGLPILAQVAARAIGLLIGLQTTVHPFSTRPSYQALAHLPLADRVRAMRDPELRTRILSEPSTGGTSFLDAVNSRYFEMFEFADPPVYEPRPEDSIGARAAATGVDPLALIYDIMLADEGQGFLYFPLANYVDGDLEAVRAMLAHQGTLNGLSDGGAHCGNICDVSMPTFLLTHWARDRQGEKFDAAYVIRRQTHDTASALGLHDRGVLKPGYRADINVIDLANLRLRRPTMRYDLPTGAKRLYQEADGYVATLCAGEPIYRNGEATGALPGRIVRGGKASPGTPPQPDQTEARPHALSRNPSQGGLS